MSCSKWAYTPGVCDGGGCPEDCDLCDKPKNMEDEDEGDWDECKYVPIGTRLREIKAERGDCDLCDKPKIAQIHNTATTQVQTDYIKRSDSIRAMAQYMMDTALIDNPEASDRIEEWEGSIAAPVMSTVKAADVVEVVRCKDCRYMSQYEQIKACCKMNSFFQEPKLVGDNDFCSRGERKDA